MAGLKEEISVSYSGKNSGYTPTSIGKWAVKTIKQNIIDKKITATGRTQNSLGFESESPYELVVFAEKGNRAPINTLQYGRSWGKRPPIEALKEWILAKKIDYSPIPYKREASDSWQPKYTPDQRGLNALAGAISTKIMKNGTNRYNKIDRTVYTPVLEKVAELFTKYVADQTKDAVLKTIKI